jgi:hypothetical protein
MQINNIVYSNDAGNVGDVISFDIDGNLIGSFNGTILPGPAPWNVSKSITMLALTDNMTCAYRMPCHNIMNNICRNREVNVYIIILLKDKINKQFEYLPICPTFKCMTR